MVQRQFGMGMGQDRRVLLWPKLQDGDKAGHTDTGKNKRGRREPGRGPHPSRKRVGEQTAGMRQSELRGKDGRTIL